MEYSRVEIRPGVWLLVPYVLHRGTKLWPDMQALSERQEELFGTVVEPIVRRIGEIHCSGFYAGFPEDEYLPGDESVLSDAIGLSLSLLLDPVTRGGLLLPDYVESEQEKLLDMIAARVNNKRSYAVLRCMEEMCAFEDYAAGRLGDEAGARAINYKKLSRHYRMLLQTCPIELFYCGHADVKKVRAILQDQLATRGGNGRGAGQPRHRLAARRMHGGAGLPGPVCVQRALRRQPELQALPERAGKAFAVLLCELSA